MTGRRNRNAKAPALPRSKFNWLSCPFDSWGAPFQQRWKRKRAIARGFVAIGSHSGAAHIGSNNTVTGCRVI